MRAVGSDLTTQQERAVGTRSRVAGRRHQHPHRDAADVRFWQILLQKSKIERPGKSRESWSLDFSAAVLRFNATTEILGRFWM